MFKFLPFIAKSLVESQNKKASMLFLLKEAYNKDVNLKTQMMIAMKEDKAENSTEHLEGKRDFQGSENRSDHWQSEFS